jgi:hypothetical protein
MRVCTEMLGICIRDASQSASLQSGPEIKISMLYIHTPSKDVHTGTSQIIITMNLYRRAFRRVSKKLITIFTPTTCMVPIQVGVNVHWKFEYNITDHASTRLSTSLEMYAQYLPPTAMASRS